MTSNAPNIIFQSMGIKEALLKAAELLDAASLALAAEAERA